MTEDDPAALRNRKDITNFNALMGNFRWFHQNLQKRIRSSDRILEVGAGGGELSNYLERKHSKRTIPLKVDGLDLWKRPDGWPPDWSWHQADLTSFDHYSPYNIILASMILHQFKEPELRRFGEKIRRNARLILASETARNKTSLFLLQASQPFLRFNWVTKNDARVSIQAGFAGEELPHMLGLPPEEWKWTCRTGLLGQYRMIAIRRQS